MENLNKILTFWSPQEAPPAMVVKNRNTMNQPRLIDIIIRQEENKPPAPQKQQQEEKAPPPPTNAIPKAIVLTTTRNHHSTHSKMTATTHWSEISSSWSAQKIVEAMSDTKDRLLQQQGCRALKKQAKKGSTYRLNICQAGGIAAIAAAMKAHPLHGDVQEQGCGALWNLAMERTGSRAIARAGTCTAIVAAMNKHSPDAEVQHWACGALRKLSEEPKNKPAIAKAGGINAIVNAINTHPNHTGVQQQASRALTNLCYDMIKTMIPSGPDKSGSSSFHHRSGKSATEIPISASS